MKWLLAALALTACTATSAQRPGAALCDRVWCTLWAEGLKAHITRRVPKPSDPLTAAYEHNPSLALCAVRERLDSTARADFHALFGAGRINDQLPPRIGTLVGYVVVRELRRDRSLDALRRLRPAEVRPLIDQTLRENGGCETPLI